MAKAANKMMVKALAKEFAPHIRVNGIAPGCIMWPTNDLTAQQKNDIIQRVPMNKTGDGNHIYHALLMLVNNDYMTGEVITVDGGRSLHM